MLRYVAKADLPSVHSSTVNGQVRKADHAFDRAHKRDAGAADPVVPVIGLEKLSD